jgi:broad specificity phosphatase PhoE
VTLVLIVRHGLTASTGTALTGWTPGISLDDRGRAQAAAVGARLAGLPIDAIVSSPLDRCQETAQAIASARPAPGLSVQIDERVGECHYGDWTGQPLRKLAKDPLWPVVQAHPSAVRFPGPAGESMVGMHLDMCQRIQVDPCSLSVIRYTPLRPFVLRMNDIGGDVSSLKRPDKKVPGASARHVADAQVGGGAGG